MAAQTPVAAQSETRSGSSGCLVALLAAAALVALIAVPALNQHALERHGGYAASAVRQLREHTPEPQDDDDRYWEGTDANGRTVHIFRLKQLAGKPAAWAIVITAGVVLVTAWITTSSRTVERMKEKCE